MLHNSSRCSESLGAKPLNTNGIELDAPPAIGVCDNQCELRSTFGESVSGPVADIVVRNWGALIALVGAMLIYASRRPAARPLALTVAGVSKAVFSALVLSHGGRFLGYQAGIAVIVDLIWIALFAAYMVAMRRMAMGAGKLGSTIGTA